LNRLFIDEARIRAILKGKPLQKRNITESVDIADIEEFSRDLVLKKIGEKFKGHELARLVEAVLNAQGYVTNRSEPGPDGGVDILAGSGPLGFDVPRICIQVKSSTSSVGVDVLRSLQGTIQSFKAEQGLLVSWGGFKRTVLNEARRSFFTIRLWESGTLLNEILKFYDKSIPIEIPLPSLKKQKRIVTIIESIISMIREAQTDIQKTVHEIMSLKNSIINNLIFKKEFPLVKFGDVLEHALNGIYKPTIFLGRGIPCLRMFNIIEGKIDFNNCVLLDVTDEELKKFECIAGDIIFNRVNSRELVGKAGIIPENSPNCVFESKNIRLRVDRKKTTPEFANYIINSANTRLFFLSVLKKQCGQATLNRKHLSNMPYPLPTLNTQRRIVAYVDSLLIKLDEIKRLHVETEKEIEELVPSFLDKAFKGEL